MKPTEREQLLRDVLEGRVRDDDPRVTAACAGDPEFARDLAERAAVEELLAATAARERDWTRAGDGPPDPQLDQVIRASVAERTSATPRGTAPAWRWRPLLAAAVSVAAAWLIWYAWPSPPPPAPEPPAGPEVLGDPDGLQLLDPDPARNSGLTLRWLRPAGTMSRVTIFDPAAGPVSGAILEHETTSDAWQLTTREMQAVSPEHHWQVEILVGTQVLDAASAPLGR